MGAEARGGSNSDKGSSKGRRAPEAVSHDINLLMHKNHGVAGAVVAVGDGTDMVVVGGEAKSKQEPTPTPCLFVVAEPKSPYCRRGGGCAASGHSVARLLSCFMTCALGSASTSERALRMNSPPLAYLCVLASLGVVL